MISPPMTALMTVAMMVAMMLPSLAPTLWRYHRVRTLQTPRALQRTTLFALGYASVWSAIGLALSALPASHVAPLASAAVVLGAGAVQRSRWKANQLLRCRAACVTAASSSGELLTAWRCGCRLGVDCALSCAAPVAVLLVGGLMDARLMVLITAAITAERIAPAGERIARLTGAVALLAGVVMCVI